MRSMFLVMYALLSDHRKLEIDRQTDAEALLHRLRGIEGNLRNLAKNTPGDSEGEETAEPGKPVWQ